MRVSMRLVGVRVGVKVGMKAKDHASPFDRSVCSCPLVRMHGVQVRMHERSHLVAVKSPTSASSPSERAYACMQTFMHARMHSALHMHVRMHIHRPCGVAISRCISRRQDLEYIIERLDE